MIMRGIILVLSTAVGGTPQLGSATHTLGRYENMKSMIFASHPEIGRASAIGNHIEQSTSAESLDKIARFLNLPASERKSRYNPIFGRNDENIDVDYLMRTDHNELRMLAQNDLNSFASKTGIKTSNNAIQHVYEFGDRLAIESYEGDLFENVTADCNSVITNATTSEAFREEVDNCAACETTQLPIVTCSSYNAGTVIPYVELETAYWPRCRSAVGNRLLYHISRADYPRDMEAYDVRLPGLLFQLDFGTNLTTEGEIFVTFYQFADWGACEGNGPLSPPMTIHGPNEIFHNSNRTNDSQGTYLGPLMWLQDSLSSENFEDGFYMQMEYKWRDNTEKQTSFVLYAVDPVILAGLVFYDDKHPVPLPDGMEWVPNCEECTAGGKGTWCQIDQYGRALTAKVNPAFEFNFAANGTCRMSPYMCYVNSGRVVVSEAECTGVEDKGFYEKISS